MQVSRQLHHSYLENKKDLNETTETLLVSKSNHNLVKQIIQSQHHLPVVTVGELLQA
jgi:hypothetical protein